MGGVKRGENCRPRKMDEGLPNKERMEHRGPSVGVKAPKMPVKTSIVGEKKVESGAGVPIAYSLSEKPANPWHSRE